MKRKIPMIIAGCVLVASIPVVIIGVVLLSMYLEHAEDSRIKDEKTTNYIGEKYGMEAIIVGETKTNFVEGHSYQMAFEEQEDVVFIVTVDIENYATIYRDNYLSMLATYEAQQQVEKLMPQIEELGFTKPLSGETIEHKLKNIKDVKTGETVRELVLETEDSYKTVEMPAIQDITKLLELVRRNNMDVQTIRLSNRGEPYGVNLNLLQMKKVHSAEEVDAYVTRRNLSDRNRAAETMQANLQEAATAAETGRFRFHKKGSEQWIDCYEANETGDCVKLAASITFKAGEMSRQNPHLEADFTAIFDFFDSIQPQPVVVEIRLADPEKAGYEMTLQSKERENYASTEQWFDALLENYPDMFE